MGTPYLTIIASNDVFKTLFWLLTFIPAAISVESAPLEMRWYQNSSVGCMLCNRCTRCRVSRARWQLAISYPMSWVLIEKIPKTSRFKYIILMINVYFFVSLKYVASLPHRNICLQFYCCWPVQNRFSYIIQPRPLSVEFFLKNVKLSLFDDGDSSQTWYILKSTKTWVNGNWKKKSVNQSLCRMTLM